MHLLSCLRGKAGEPGSVAGEDFVWLWGAAGTLASGPVAGFPGCLVGPGCPQPKAWRSALREAEAQVRISLKA